MKPKLSTLLSLTVLMAFGCTQSPQIEKNANLIEVDDSTVQEQIYAYEHKPVFIEFYAHWCPPCKILTPRVEKMAKKYKSKLKFVKIDVEKAPHMVERYQIESIPTMQIYSKKCSDNKVLVGVKPEAEIEQFIENALKDCI